MERPYQELARLVGKVLAKRWLNRFAKQETRPRPKPNVPKVNSRDEPVADVAEPGNKPQV